MSPEGDQHVVGVLSRDEIARRIHAGQLIRNPRFRPDGVLDLEGASYDLTAGIVVWKSPPAGRDRGETKTLFYRPEPGIFPGWPAPTGLPALWRALKPRAIRQTVKRALRITAHSFARTQVGPQLIDPAPTVTLEPGQMIFVITAEDVVLPRDIVGTVYSRNSLALKGILALNAGHIDPGFEGPIVIRLINLRANSWTLALGEPIFTIVFQSLGHRAADDLTAHKAYSRADTLQRVRDTADQALANALLDVYAEKLGTEFIRRGELGHVLFRSLAGSLLSGVLWVTTVLGGLAAILALFGYGSEILSFLRGLWSLWNPPALSDAL